VVLTISRKGLKQTRHPITGKTTLNAASKIALVTTLHEKGH